MNGKPGIEKLSQPVLVFGDMKDCQLPSLARPPAVERPHSLKLLLALLSPEGLGLAISRELILIHVQQRLLFEEAL